VPAHDPWVTLPRRVVRSSLTAAGLAGWVLAKNHLGQEADETRELQDALEAALRSGSAGAVRVPRATVERAARFGNPLPPCWSRGRSPSVTITKLTDRQRASVRGSEACAKPLRSSEHTVGDGAFVHPHE
jgi:hypothetical protein